MKVARLKIAPSEANVKANRKESTKWTYHRKQSFASDIFIFFKKNSGVLQKVVNQKLGNVRNVGNHGILRSSFLF